MSYLKLLGAHRKNRDVPSMKKVDLTAQQQAWAAIGRCVQCGQTEAAKGSFICESCQAADTIEDIRDEITALRQKLMRGKV